MEPTNYGQKIQYIKINTTYTQTITSKSPKKDYQEIPILRQSNQQHKNASTEWHYIWYRCWILLQRNNTILKLCFWYCASGMILQTGCDIVYFVSPCAQSYAGGYRLLSNMEHTQLFDGPLLVLLAKIIKNASSKRATRNNWHIWRPIMSQHTVFL